LRKILRFAALDTVASIAPLSTLSVAPAALAAFATFTLRAFAALVLWTGLLRGLRACVG
jgi:hypothetical protein